jgi:hypothetical protein
MQTYVGVSKSPILMSYFTCSGSSIVTAHQYSNHEGTSQNFPNDLELSKKSMLEMVGIAARRCFNSSYYIAGSGKRRGDESSYFYTIVYPFLRICE